MRTWTPLVVSVVLAVGINLFPIFMAFVVRAEGFVQAGWAFYFFLVPAAVVLLLLGLVISLVLWFRRRRA